MLGRHTNRMEKASRYVELSDVYMRYAKLMLDEKRKGIRVIEGWEALTLAIEEVVECGCPRSMWPDAVQEAIKE